MSDTLKFSAKTISEHNGKKMDPSQNAFPLRPGKS